MIGIRKRVLFRVEESFPDPEEQKWRFRRRILLGTLFITLVILGIPVMQDQIPHLRTMRQARSLAKIILETRLYATQHRTAVSLRLDPADRRTWIRAFHPNGECTHADNTPPEKISLTASVWRIQPLTEETSPPNEIQVLCFEPLRGLLTDGLASHEVKIAIQGFPEEDIESERTDRVAQLILAHEGASLTILRN